MTTRSRRWSQPAFEQACSAAARMPHMRHTRAHSNLHDIVYVRVRCTPGPCAHAPARVYLYAYPTYKSARVRTRRALTWARAASTAHSSHPYRHTLIP